MIATLVVKTLGMIDTCDELQELSKFRDGWLVANRPGAKESYYKIAPGIVKKLEAFPREKLLGIATFLYNYYIVQAVGAIKDGNPELAYNIYTAMVTHVKNITEKR